MIYDLSYLNQAHNARMRLSQLETKKVIIELTHKQESRTNDQNRYLHVLFNLFGIQFGYTLSEAKRLIKGSCPFMIYTKNGKKFARSTADLDKEEMTDFIEWFRNYSAKEGFYLWTPDEYMKGNARIDQHIKEHRQWL